MATNSSTAAASSKRALPSSAGRRTDRDIPEGEESNLCNSTGFTDGDARRSSGNRRAFAAHKLYLDKSIATSIGPKETKMNYLINDFEDSQETFSVKFRNVPAPNADTGERSSRKTFGRRRGRAPQQFNGIHRRRNKKIRW
jgi:hypothetical protein